MQDLTKKLEETALETAFSGVVSIYAGPRPVFERAFGYRDVKNRLPNQVSTRFGIASGTKLFTALAIGRLIDRGLLALETTVGSLDPAWSGFIDPRATIRHLLTHTSGIYDYFDEESEQDWDNFFVAIPWSKLETPGDYAPLFENQPAKFEAGQRFSYSNGGYVFLGMLIEKLSGKPYRDFVEAQVLQPAGMGHSGFYALNDLPGDTANGYLEDRHTTNIYNLPLRGGGDGGMFTTAADLRSFWDNLLAFRILSKELTETFLSTQHPFDERSGYGCGIYKRLDESMYSIVGGDAGVGFDSRIVLKPKKLTISILSNITNGEEAIREVVMDSLARGLI